MTSRRRSFASSVTARALVALTGPPSASPLTAAGSAYWFARFARSRPHHAVDGRRLVAFAGHGPDEILRLVERRAPPWQVGERIPAGRQEVEGGPIGGSVDAEGTQDAQLFEHDEVGPEARRVGRPPGAGHDDRAARP